MSRSSTRRPVLAAALAVSPGLGHFYLREWVRGLLWIGIFASTTSILVDPAVVAGVTDPASLLGAVVDAVQSLDSISRLALGSVVGVSMVDAYWIAARANYRAATDAGDRCESCGRDVEDDDLSFCKWCGADL